jgi:hypothetical protein
MGSPVGSWIFLFFILPINRGGHSKVLDSINQLTEAGRITASVIQPLMVTFKWRRLPLPASGNQK